MNWALLAVLAAVIWGIEYTFVERVLDKAPSLCLYFYLHVVLTVAAFLLMVFTRQPLTPRPLYETDNGVSFGLICLTGFIAGLSVTGSIKASGNATASSLIEISYPFFVALFSWMFFRQNRMNWQTLCGGSMILGGILLVIRSRPHG